MRVLVIAATYPPTRCGVGDYVRRLGHELAGRGASILVLSGASEDDHDHGDPLEFEPVAARPAPTDVAPPVFESLGDGVSLARAVETWDWSALDVIAAALRANAFDVVNLQYHGEDYLLHPAICAVADLCHEQRVPLVLTLHNLQQPRPWPGTHDPLQHLLRGSQAWITTNLIDERRLRELEGARERLHRIATGPSITAPTEPMRPTRNHPFRVSYFGFLNPFKGIEYLLRATARLRDEGVDIRLTVAAGVHTDAPGRLREYVAFIDDEIARLDLAPILDRRGYVPDEEVTALLAEAHLTVFPFREGLSGKNTSFWSTLHHAVPALTTAGEGLPDGVADGENVLLSPIDDEAALAERMRWAIEHADDLEAIGRAGRELVRRRFDWGDLADQTLAVFAEAGADLRGGGQ